MSRDIPLLQTTANLLRDSSEMLQRATGNKRRRMAQNIQDVMKYLEQLIKAPYKDRQPVEYIKRKMTEYGKICQICKQTKNSLARLQEEYRKILLKLDDRLVQFCSFCGKPLQIPDHLKLSDLVWVGGQCTGCGNFISVRDHFDKGTPVFTTNTDGWWEKIADYRKSQEVTIPSA
ncbi:MAG: hypothetical protein M1338_05425 [Patescibacteria group bacterium]|nr:hypothetical protein [Patescibacteria group bacterium]